jgi:hypothetical protein
VNRWYAVPVLWMYATMRSTEMVVCSSNEMVVGWSSEMVVCCSRELMLSCSSEMVLCYSRELMLCCSSEMVVRCSTVENWC